MPVVGRSIKFQQSGHHDTYNQDRKRKQDHEEPRSIARPQARLGPAHEAIELEHKRNAREVNKPPVLLSTPSRLENIPSR